MKTEITTIREYIKNYFNKKKKPKKFIPGKSTIPIASPPYSSDEVIEALDSMLNMKTTMGEKVRLFEKNLRDILEEDFQLWSIQVRLPIC